MPATIRPIETSRAGSVDSPSNTMPRIGRADRADAGPYGIAGADRQGLQRDAQQHEAYDHRAGRQHRRHQTG